MDTAMGFLPNPKGPVFVNKAIFGSGQTTMDAQKQLRRRNDDLPDDEDEENEPRFPAADGSFDYDMDAIFPPANRTQEELVLIRQRLLPDTGKKIQ
jgi:hypothetical protein